MFRIFIQRFLPVILVLAWTLPGESAANDDVPFFDFCERQPIVRIPPAYPRRAAERGIEGFTMLDLHVDATGSVSDATVVEAEPSGRCSAVRVGLDERPRVLRQLRPGGLGAAVKPQGA